MAKPTIAELQARIEYLEEQKNNWYQKYSELKQAEEKRDGMKMAQLDEEKYQTDKQITNLMEIIRWQIRPNTAESPFMPTKNEREDFNQRRNY
jgi:hypothetical protein